MPVPGNPGIFVLFAGMIPYLTNPMKKTTLLLLAMALILCGHTDLSAQKKNRKQQVTDQVPVQAEAVVQPQVQAVTTVPVIVDGQVRSDLHDGDTIEITPAKTPLRIITHPGLTFFKTLSTKLKWGLNPGHGGGLSE